MVARIVKLDRILKSRKASLLSPPLLIAKELKLKYLIEEGRLLVGPAVGLSVLIDRLTRIIPINSMLDLCCGSGALTKIAMKNGVTKIVCVDKNVKAVEKNLGRKNNVRIIKADVLKFKIEEFFDLIILDAPRILIPRLFPKFKEYSSKSNIFVLWHGSCEEVEWNEKVRRELKEFFKSVYSFSIYGEEISACSSTKDGVKRLMKFYREW